MKLIEYNTDKHSQQSILRSSYTNLLLHTSAAIQIKGSFRFKYALSLADFGTK